MSLFFESISKIDRPLAQRTSRKKERTQMNRIRSEQGDIRTDTKQIHAIRREHLSNLYSIKLENLKEMNEFLDSAKLPKLNKKSTV